MNKTPIEYLIDHYGCNDENDLRDYLGDDISLTMLSDAMEIYAHAYHLKLLEAKKGEFVTMDMTDLERWNMNSA